MRRFSSFPGPRFPHPPNQFKVAHLDVKPENILISVQNRAKLTDFDTVLPLGRQVGRMRGTHEYHPPEYFEKSAWYTVGVHGDSWALSLVAYEVLLGGYV